MLKKQLLEKTNREKSVSQLSFGERSLLFLYLNSPESSAYNVSFAVRIISEFNAEAAKKSFQKLLNKHSALRTNYKISDNNVVREVHGYKDIRFEIVDVGNLNEEEVRTLIEEEHRKPFDLENGDIIRVFVFKKSEKDSILLFNMHHIAADGWSLGILLEEFIGEYVNETLGRPSLTKPVKKNYPDFIKRQLDFVESAEGKKQLNYWQEELKDDLTTLSLDTDFPRPAVQTYNGATEHFQIDKRTSEKLKQISRDEGSTLIVALLTAYAVFLHRYSGQNEITIGLATAGRGKSEFDELVGYLINPVAIRISFDEDVSFTEIMQQVKVKVRQAISNEDYPFALLVEKLLHKRDASRAPVFQTFFGLQKFVGNDVLQELIVPGNENEVYEWEGLKVSPYIIKQQDGQFDITIEFVEGKNGFSGALKFNKDLFEAKRIVRMKEHFLNMLNDVAVYPEKKISKLNLISEKERSLIIEEWNKTDFDYSGFDCVHNVFDNEALKRPEAIAVEFENEMMTYCELKEKSNQLANYLVNAGVNNNSLVGLCMERSMDMIVCILGILKAGGAYIPIDTSYPSDRIEHMLNDSGAKFILTHKQILAERKSSARIIYIDEETEKIEAEQKDFKSNVSFEDIAYVIYTSGSTGMPKGVMITHRALSNHMFWMKNVFGFNSSDAVLQKTPFSFDASVWEFYAPLMTGGRLVIAKPEGHMDMPYMIELIIKKSVTVLQLVPSLLKMLLEENGIKNCRSLKNVFCGGEALSKELCDKLFEKLDVNFYNLYGPTEVTIDSVYHKCSKDSENERIPIGKPVYNVHAYILDKYMNPVPVGVTGELYLGGMSVSKGYLNNEHLTNERFVADIFRDMNSKLYRTGDLVRYRENGLIDFAGRSDSQVKFRGFRIELGEIESKLLGNEKVKNVAVILREDKPGVQRLVAYIEAGSSETIQTDELKKFVRRSLPEYMIPQSFVFMNELPKTPNGKIDKNALPEPESTFAGNNIVQPRNEVEKILLEIWKQLLGVREIGINDNFFELGGDSIISIQIISRASQSGIKLSPKQMFLHQTIAELAAVAETSNAVSEHSDSEGEVSLTPIQKWFFERKIPDVNHYNHSTLLKIPKGLDEKILEESVQQLMNRHDVFRLRFKEKNAGWIQYYSGMKEFKNVFKVVDIGETQTQSIGECIRKDIQVCQKEINIVNGPLMQVRLYRTPDEEDRLLVMIHHIIVDGISWRIILEDLSELYIKKNSVKEIKTDSFKSWSERLRAYSVGEELKSEAAYWRELLEKKFDKPVRDFDSDNDAIATELQVVREMNEDMTKSLLKEASRAYNTKINDLLLTALGMALCECFGGRKYLVEMEGHGREEVIGGDFSRTAGWFTSIFPVGIEINDNINIEASIKSVKETLHRIPHNGIGFGILKYSDSDNELKKSGSVSTQAEIVFNYLGQFNNKISDDSAWKFGNTPLILNQHDEGKRCHLIEINSIVSGGKFRIEFAFSKNVFRIETIDNLAANFIRSLQNIIQHCTSAESTGYTPSDFSAAGLDQHELDNLIANLN